MRKSVALKAFFLCLMALSLIVLPGCNASSGGDNGDGGGDTGGMTTTTGDGVVSISFTSLCGAVINAILENPVTTAIEVTLVPQRSDLIVVTRLSGPNAGTQQLIKLHGVTADGVSPAAIQRGVDLINSLTGGRALLVLAGDGCDISVNGGLGVVGQLFTLAGENITEALLQIGAVTASVDICGSDLLVGCYQAIEPEVSNLIITDFLWKPVSERDGNLVVLIDPFNVTVVVTGAVTETLVPFGPSNGRGTTARSSSRSGGGFGANIRVEFFDSSGLRVLTNSGAESITVPNGAQRSEQRF